MDNLLNGLNGHVSQVDAPPTDAGSGQRVDYMGAYLKALAEAEKVADTVNSWNVPTEEIVKMRQDVTRVFTLDQQADIAEHERVERVYEMLHAGEPNLKVRIWNNLEHNRIKRIKAGTEGEYTPPKRLPVVKQWNDLTAHEFQDLSSACEDGQIAVSAGKKPRGFDGREWVTPARINRLEAAKLVKSTRLEIYPDDIEAVCFVPTAKGIQWREARAKLEQAQQQDKFLKFAAESPDPLMQKFNRDIQLAEQVSHLPIEAQQAIMTFLEIVTLENKWAWLKSEVTPGQVVNGKTVMGIMVLAFIDTQDKSIQTAVINAMSENGKLATASE